MKGKSENSGENFPPVRTCPMIFLRIFLQWGPALWPKAKEHYEEHSVHGQPGDNVSGGVGESVVDNHHHLCRPHDNRYNHLLQISQAFCEDSFGWKFWHQIYILTYWNILSNISNIAGVLRGLFWRRLRAAAEEGSRRAADRQALEKRSHHWGHLDCDS